MFRVGQKVVCVDAYSPPGTYWLDEEKITEGGIYTIKSIFPDFRGKIVVSLNETFRPIIDGQLRGYRFDRFRPLVERKTDISIFKKMLNKQAEKV